MGKNKKTTSAGSKKRTASLGSVATRNSENDVEFRTDSELSKEVGDVPSTLPKGKRIPKSGHTDQIVEEGNSDPNPESGLVNDLKIDSTNQGEGVSQTPQEPVVDDRSTQNRPSQVASTPPLDKGASTGNGRGAMGVQTQTGLAFKRMSTSTTKTPHHIPDIAALRKISLNGELEMIIYCTLLNEYYKRYLFVRSNCLTRSSTMHFQLVLIKAIYSHVAINVAWQSIRSAMLSPDLHE